MANLLCSVSKIEVDNRLPISYYFRMASHMIKQAKVYRDEHNVVDLYVILLKYSSLVTETISQHQNYHHCSNTEKMHHKKVLKEFEKELAVLRPLVKQKLDGTNRNNTIEISKDKSGIDHSCLSHRRKDRSGFTGHSFKSVRLVQDFLELARGNTENNLETRSNSNNGREQHMVRATATSPEHHGDTREQLQLHRNITVTQGSNCNFTGTSR
ncbi:AMSH-like ubiquitin thioesterase 3 [Nymphaea thermarum]|nr:AMSH-like ubiquitin thioesterase 3 [Nymphaea thermarum]